MDSAVDIANMIQEIAETVQTQTQTTAADFSVPASTTRSCGAENENNLQLHDPTTGSGSGSGLGSGSSPGCNSDSILGSGSGSASVVPVGVGVSTVALAREIDLGVDPLEMIQSMSLSQPLSPPVIQGLHSPNALSDANLNRKNLNSFDGQKKYEFEDGIFSEDTDWDGGLRQSASADRQRSPSPFGFSLSEDSHSPPRLTSAPSFADSIASSDSTGSGSVSRSNKSSYEDLQLFRGRDDGLLDHPPSAYDSATASASAASSLTTDGKCSEDRTSSASGYRSSGGGSGGGLGGRVGGGGYARSQYDRESKREFVQRADEWRSRGDLYRSLRIIHCPLTHIILKCALVFTIFPRF